MFQIERMVSILSHATFCTVSRKLISYRRHCCCFPSCLALTQGFFCVAAILYPHAQIFWNEDWLQREWYQLKRGNENYFWIFLFCRLFVLILVLISKKYRPMGLGSVLARDRPTPEWLSWVEWVSWVRWVYRWVKSVRANIFFDCKQSQRIFRKSSNQDSRRNIQIFENWSVSKNHRIY